jgi:bis(5'-nucleosyl)-tetraphosphatase (symmetrical)
MAIWAIGDLQGCHDSLERLLPRLALDPAHDRLWLVGDLVNRGPRSLDVLRWAAGLGERAVVVLGNHDLHLLARAAGLAGAKKRDTLDEVLAAPDRDELIDWLRRRPLVHVEAGHLLVHAGLAPPWSAAAARAVAAEVEAVLAGDDWRAGLAELVGHREPPRPWDDALTGAARRRAALAFLVRVRCLDERGAPDPAFSDHPRQARRGLEPWFGVADAAWRDHTVVFGHWAALGLSFGPHHLGLDSGCVWGGELTAVRLEDRHVVQVAAVE